MAVWLACVSVYYVHAWYPKKPEEGTGSPATGVTCAHGTLGTDLLCKSSKMLLTAEPTLPAPFCFFWHKALCSPEWP